ncbi:hypothetical protein SUGI_0647420 [Cryptomeria japonica]|uniref:dirigent protein 1-like n=1 Tax=Cryptomeria japonica TaxID=3369 RepID=UPI0024148253|nr:dirigent protein 1-like [Cryptomeria japonica]GLJ32158.1 hypothetical protein SUGI_0647420 [Cryptomeria japonica]
MVSKPALITFLSLIVLGLSFSSFWAFKEEKLVFYSHGILTGENITEVVVAGVNGLILSPEFGAVIVADDPVTEGPDPSSKTIARAKGIYVSSDLGGTNFELLLSVVFENEKYNGSTLEIQGADRYLQEKREVSVVGGTGYFRYARGYAILETASVQGFNAIGKFTVNVRLG